ncbi:MAG: hypothetical protein Q8K58_04615 [Acidimicrobiales bacterium]|nr:hypothetical protein [Acidimicrobiales bacterium]
MAQVMTSRMTGTQAGGWTTPAPINPERFNSLRRSCPTCGKLGVRIVYGCASGSLLRAAERGMVVIGGSTHRASTHRCPDGHEWHSPDVPW